VLELMRVPRTPKPRVPRGSVAEKRPSAKGSVAEPRPLPPRGDIDHDEHDVTSRRVLYEIPEIVDSDSDPGDSSIEMTAQRPMFDASDSVEMTAERSPILDQSGLEVATTDLDSTVIEVEADLPDDPRGVLVTKPRFDRDRDRDGDRNRDRNRDSEREREHERGRDRPSYEQDDSEPEIQVGRPLPSRFHNDDAPEVTSPRAPAVGTNRKLARKQFESPPPTPTPPTGPGPGETFEHLETRALDEFMEPTRIQQPIHEMEDRPTTNLDPGERGLLAAIAEGSEPSRLKYADWLQRHGEGARAEYLRVDHELAKTNPSDPKFDQLVHRRTDLAARISVDWRSRVSRSPIEGCSAFDRPCPSRWAALTADADDVRACQVCRKDVYYCATIQLAQGRVRNGDPVAIDVTCQRWPGDLGGHCVQCNSFVPSEARFCPHCGQSMQLVIHMA